MHPDNKGRASLVSVITTPLGFFALALLIVEGFLGITMIGSGFSPVQKFWGMMIGAFLFLCVIFIVTILVWMKPQSLTFGEKSYLEQLKMYGDQSTPKSKSGLVDETKIEAKSEPLELEKKVTKKPDRIKAL